MTGISDPKVTKTSPSSFTPGVNSTYTIKVDNVGTIATSGNIIVTDTLPAGISYVSLSGTGWASTANGIVSGRQWRRFTYSGAALAAGTGTTTLTMTVSIAAAGATSITNRAWVSGGGNVITSNDSSSVTTTINGADLTIVKTAGTLTYGSSGTYTLTVTNAGTAATSGTITVTDTLPSGASWVSGTGTNWTVSHANGVVTATRSTAISASATASFTVTVNITSTADSISNKAYVTGGGQLVTTNDTSRITKAIVFPTPNLTILKSISAGASGGTIKPGEDMTYNIHFQNTGAGGAVSVVVTDVMPTQVYFKLNSVSSTITGGITATLQYFDGNAWVSSLTDGGCSAPAGYSGCVQKIRWSLGSTLPASAVGDIFFVVRVR